MEIVLLIPFIAEENGSSRAVPSLPRGTPLVNTHSDIAETGDHPLYSVQTVFPRVGDISESSSPATCQLIFWFTFPPSTLTLHCSLITVQTVAISVNVRVPASFFGGERRWMLFKAMQIVPLLEFLPHAFACKFLKGEDFSWLHLGYLVCC